MRINCLRWCLFKRKIKKQLPRFHPETGQLLSWNISIVYGNVKGYDSTTGKRIGGYPVLSIIENRRRPGMKIGSNKVYYFDWKNKQVKDVKGLRWI